MNTSKRIATILLSALASCQLSDVAAAPARTTLCAPNESVLFSCNIARKIASVCASPDLTGSSGSIFYRFGTPSRIELTYPQGKQHPSSAFDISFDHWAKGHSAELSFTVGDVTYVVTEYSSSLAGSWSGVAVRRAHRPPVQLSCSDYPNSKLAELEDLHIFPEEDPSCPELRYRRIQAEQDVKSATVQSSREATQTVLDALNAARVRLALVEADFVYIECRQPR